MSCRIEFGVSIGYWVMTKATLKMSIDNKGSNVDFNQEMVPGNVVSPLSFSYHCTPKMNLISYGIGNGTGSGEIVALEMNGFQLQPFGIDAQGRFGDW